MSTVLRVWLMPSAGLRSSAAFAERLNPFLKKHPEISIELRMIPWSRGWTEIMHAYKRGDLPDVFQVGSTWIDTLAHLHLLSPAPSGVKRRPAIAPWVDSLAQRNGLQLALPWILECSVMAIRPELLEKVGLDAGDLADWEGFYQSCLELSHGLARSQGKGGHAVPLVLHSRPEYNTLHWAVPWLWSGGWRSFDPSASPFQFLSDPSAVPGFSFMAKLFQCSPGTREIADAPANRICSDFFETGRYPIYLGPSDIVMRACAEGGTAQGRSQGARINVVPIPRGPDGSKTRAGGSWLCVSRHSKHRAAAWELVAYMTDDPFLSWRADAGGEFPAYDCEYWESPHDEQRALLRSILQTASTYPQHPMWHTFERTLMSGISEIFWRFIQGSSYDEKAQEIARRIDQSIANLKSLGWEIPA